MEVSIMTKKKFYPSVSTTPSDSIEPVKTEEVTEPVKEEIPAEPAEIETPEPEVEAVVNGVETALNIRKKPEIKPNNQIGIVGKGTKIIVVNPEKPVKKNGEEWYKVKLNGEPGYAMKKYIKVI